MTGEPVSDASRPDGRGAKTTATVTDLEGSPVTFNATADDGLPPVPEITVLTQPPATALEGEVFGAAFQPVVQVEDGSGNPLAGVTVTAALASGSGTLEGATTAVSGSDGVATFGDLGVAGQGRNTIEFRGCDPWPLVAIAAIGTARLEETSGGNGVRSRLEHRAAPHLAASYRQGHRLGPGGDRRRNGKAEAVGSRGGRAHRGDQRWRTTRCSSVPAKR